MKLVSMKKDSDEAYEGCAMPSSNFGYGLELSINPDQCEAIGLTKPLPAGTIVMIQAQAIVVSSTESVEDDSDDAGNDVRMSLQITDLGVEPVGTDPNPAKTLYGTN